MYTNPVKRVLFVYFLIYELKFLKTLVTTKSESGVTVALKPYTILHKRVRTHSIGGNIKYFDE